METLVEFLPVVAGIFVAQGIQRCHGTLFSGLFPITGIGAAALINLFSGESTGLLPMDISVTLASGIAFSLLKVQFLKKYYGR